MSRALFALAALVLLASCGADGMPTPPAPTPAVTPAGVTMGGTLSVGIARNGTGP